MRPPACVRCGYDLTGVGAGREWARCPECGHAFDPARPSPRPWPHPARLALRIALPPTALVLALAIMVRAAESLGSAVRAGVALAEPVVVVATFLLPAYAAWRIASVHAVRYERWLIWAVLAVVGESYATGLMFVAFLIAGGPSR